MLRAGKTRRWKALTAGLVCCELCTQNRGKNAAIVPFMKSMSKLWNKNTAFSIKLSPHLLYLSPKRKYHHKHQNLYLDRNMALQLTAQQEQVMAQIREFLSSDAAVFILRGYAGTGKTTMIKQVVASIPQPRNLRLMAPTGRAARVLNLKTGYEATTIHKGIYSLNRLQAKKVKDIADTEFKFCFPVNLSDEMTIAIVDEASMISAHMTEQELFEFGSGNLLEDLLTYLRPNFGGKVIFVGDPAQLPPVGETESQALSADYFRDKGLRVMQAELTEVLRQTGDSVILKDAMMIRDLLGSAQRNKLVLEEKQGDVVSLSAEELLPTYYQVSASAPEGNAIVICYSNRAARAYNQAIRRERYAMEAPPLQVGDRLMVVQNNHTLGVMNGEFVRVVEIGESLKQSAPVYVQEGGQKVRKVIEMHFAEVTIAVDDGSLIQCLIQLDVLDSEYRALCTDEVRALYINFCMRHPQLTPGSEDFVEALRDDPYYNALKAKYGYAVTGHKCQGGEWDNVFVDFDGRTGLSDDSLRWTYTAVTRAAKTLYLTHLPHITPFSKFRIEPVQGCSTMKEECRVLGKVEPSPFHDASAPDFLRAKYQCIRQNMEGTPYSVRSVLSRPYQEIYRIQTPDGLERYDLRYKKGGIFTKAQPQVPTQHSVMIQMMLDDERAMPLQFSYQPSDPIREQLYHLIRSACDTLTVPLTNVVEHPEDYSVMYYFRTSNTPSYLKIYLNSAGFVTYAKPMSLFGADDAELKLLIDEIQSRFDS
jgi:hypothetical protein